VEGAQANIPLIEDRGCVSVVSALEPREVEFQQREFVFDFRVARGDDREPLGLSSGIPSARDEFVGLDLEHAREQGDGSFPGVGHTRLEMRDGNARDADALGEFLLRPTELGPKIRDSAAQAVVVGVVEIRQLPTHLADGGDLRL